MAAELGMMTHHVAGYSTLWNLLHSDDFHLETSEYRIRLAGMVFFCVGTVINTLLLRDKTKGRGVVGGLGFELLLFQSQHLAMKSGMVHFLGRSNFDGDAGEYVRCFWRGSRPYCAGPGVPLRTRGGQQERRRSRRSGARHVFRDVLDRDCTTEPTCILCGRVYPRGSSIHG